MQKQKHLGLALFLILLVFLGGIFFAYQTGKRLKNIEAILNNFQAQNHEQYTFLNSRLASLSYELEETLKKQNENFFDESYMIDGYDPDSGLLDINFTFSLKEFEKDAPVYLKAGDATVLAEEGARGTFSATLQVKGDGDTDISYLTDGSTVKSEKLLTISPMQKLRGRFKYDTSIYINTDKNSKNIGTAEFEVLLVNDHQGKDDLKAEKCELLFYSNDELLKSFDLTAYMKSTADSEIINIPDFDRDKYERDLARFAAGENVGKDFDHKKPSSPLILDLQFESSGGSAAQNYTAKLRVTDKMGIIYIFEDFSLTAPNYAYSTSTKG